MKNLLLLTSLLITLSALSQKIKVTESNLNIGGGTHNAFIVTIYETDAAGAEDAFRSYMKMYNGKRSSKNGEVFIDNAVINEMGNNTVDIYGRAEGSEGDQKITFIIAFDLGGAFLNSTDHKDQYQTAEKIVKDFAIKATKDAIREKLKDAQKIQAKMETAQKSLEKDNKNLVEDIDDYKTKIKKAEDDIVKNKSSQEKKKAEIEAQKKTVTEINDRLNAVE